MKSKGYEIILFIAFLFICLVFVLSLSGNDVIYHTGTTPKSNRIYIPSYNFREEPILLTPSRVRVLSMVTMNEEQACTHSPEVDRRISDYNFHVLSDEVVRTTEDVTRSCYKFTKTRKDFGSEGEMLCCKIFEEMVEEPVENNIRPNWLKNPLTKRNLELDCFYRKKGIAIEYNGSYHYKYVPCFHKGGEKDLIYTKKKDALKKELCEKAGIKLIVVPYTVDYAKKDKNGKWQDCPRPLKEREKLLRAYIEPYLYEYLQD